MAEYEEFFDIKDEINKQAAEREAGQGPPNLSPEKVQILDNAATISEVEKLQQPTLIEAVEEKSQQNGVAHLDTTAVFDWRFRGIWKRRCRIVAREYRTDNTTEEQFSPTSAMFVIRLLLMLGMMMNLEVYAADIKDAFFMVPQQEEVWISVRKWVNDLSDGTNPLLEAKYWRLRRCLPGQRSAALRWADYFRQLVVSHGLLLTRVCRYANILQASHTKHLPDHSCGRWLADTCW